MLLLPVVVVVVVVVVKSYNLNKDNYTLYISVKRPF